MHIYTWLQYMCPMKLKRMGRIFKERKRHRIPSTQNCLCLLEGQLLMNDGTGIPILIRFLCMSILLASKCTECMQCT